MRPSGTASQSLQGMQAIGDGVSDSRSIGARLTDLDWAGIERSLDEWASSSTMRRERRRYTLDRISRAKVS